MLVEQSEAAIVDGRVSDVRRETRGLALIRRMLARGEVGHLRIETPGGRTFEITGSRPGTRAALVVHRWRVLRRLLTKGPIGFAESYMDGDWSTPDLAAFLLWANANKAALQAVTRGLSVTRLMQRLWHARRSNTRAGSRRNIEAHYDLGNDFFAPWLDAGMNYSSALFTSPGQTLEEAQLAKIDRAIALLDLKGGERVLEIGCGWGALAERLTTVHGCEVTALTLSREQFAYAKRRLRHCQPGRADVRLLDYRDIEGQFDRVISIEMLEAVGEAMWPCYFAKIRSCLRPGGVAVVQSISIEGQRFAAYRRQPDFIQRYIFPGGMLPTARAIACEAFAAGLTLESTELFGASYARTLAEWQHRFHAAWPLIQSYGFDAPFRRMWDYYLAYCRAGFELGSVDVGFYRLRRES
jgi:cyclopropane-fatty-acyl-phospholipid synthase